MVHWLVKKKEQKLSHDMQVWFVCNSQNPDTTHSLCCSCFLDLWLPSRLPDSLGFVIVTHWIFSYYLGILTYWAHKLQNFYVNWKMKNARLMKTWHKLVTTYSKMQLEKLSYIQAMHKILMWCLFRAQGIEFVLWAFKY